MEIWKKIENYPDYEVSNLGRIKSYKQNKNGKILKGKNSHGYIAIDLSLDGKIKTEFLHRLVLMTFSPIENLDTLTVNHKDGDRLNNKLENLEWMSLSDNVKHAREELKTGNYQRKVRVVLLTGEEKIFNSVYETAENLGYSKGTISRWVNGTRSYNGKILGIEYLN